jgi:hypothetical protein
MRYSTPTIFLKYLQYYWVAANSKGHGIHSPFVYQFIRDTLNAKSSFEQIHHSAPGVHTILQEIEAISSSKIKPKIKLIIARLLQSLNPLTYSVTGDKKQFETIDFAFIGDGQDETNMLENANKLIDKMHANSWVILHGIHSDSNMEAAWKKLKQHVKIRLTIDLFSIGILFCRTAQKEKEHFIIRY